jgi:hypothetical protein
MMRVQFLAGIMIFPTASRLALGSNQFSGYLVSYPELQSSDEVQFVWSYGTHIFMAWGNTDS